MKNIIPFLCAIIFLMANYRWCKAEGSDSLLAILDKKILEREAKTQIKFQEINQLKKKLTDYKKIGNIQEEFQTTYTLFKEYEAFIFDSAYMYVNQLIKIEKQINNDVLSSTAQIALGKIYLLKGMFKEAMDILEHINIEILDNQVKMDYFMIMVRLYFDARDYVRDTEFSRVYHQKALAYCDSIIAHNPKNSKLYAKYHGFKNLAEHDWIVARAYFLDLDRKFPLNEHEKAVIYSCLGGICFAMEDARSGMEYLIKSAIADINSSTKETTALRYLAEHLFKAGDIERAQRYIKIAKEDADFFGSNFRKLQISLYLPIIEAEMQTHLQQQRSRILVYAVIISALTIGCVVFLIILFRQIKKLQKARLLVMKTFRELRESEKIKEKYIGYYFNISTHFMNRLEQIKTAINNQMVQNKPNGLKQIVSSINVNEDREVIYTDFDKMFLELFPHFLSEFDKLFSDENRIKIKENQRLTVEHRIFALIRLGILNTNKIAEILNLSVNTVYTYKAKVKKMSLIPNSDFESKVREMR